MPSPLATGGTVTYVDLGDGTFDEVHSFTSSGTLEFIKFPKVQTFKEILVVGG